MSFVKIAHTSNASNVAFIGYKSKMRSCRVTRVGNDRLFCEMTLGYRLFGTIIGLLIGAILTVHFIYGSFNDAPFLAFVMGIAATGLAWLIFLRSILFRRMIEIDASSGSIEFIERWWRERRESLLINQLGDVLIEKVVRLKNSEGSDNPWNRIDCWLLRIVLKDGRSRVLCETTDRSVMEEMSSFLCKCVTRGRQS